MTAACSWPASLSFLRPRLNVCERENLKYVNTNTATAMPNQRRRFSSKMPVSGINWVLRSKGVQNWVRRSNARPPSGSARA